LYLGTVLDLLPPIAFPPHPSVIWTNLSVITIIYLLLLVAHIKLLQSQQYFYSTSAVLQYTYLGYVKELPEKTNNTEIGVIIHLLGEGTSMYSGGNTLVATIYLKFTIFLKLTCTARVARAHRI
jgi:hypothetical protein